uniref:Histone chaperone asf1 n=1 Tax=Caligus clemensi TaxID=344056 RepID=C1C2Q9_CALCM|nr:Histone chaperone asf1 [Caligus clemensi]
MAKIHVCNVLVLDNPAEFLSKLEFEITFECLEDLQEDLEWKIIYVGSAESEEYDQVLDTVYVGPVPEGRHKFVFTADPPNPDIIPVSDVVGVTVILITCSYRSQEFIRVGYYVNNSYAEDPQLQEEPPSQPLFNKLKRNILATNPRVTKFKINWDSDSSSNANNAEQSNNENQAPPPINQLPAKDPNLDSPLKSGLMNENSSSFQQQTVSMGSMDCD